MIVTKTPFRVTLGGGGTDLPSFYSKHGGFIFAMGLDKYMYMMVNHPVVDSWIRVHHREIEMVRSLDELQHDLAREVLRRNGIADNIEISAMADIPAGTGLGSSGCYLVGLLAAIRALQKKSIAPRDLAEEACHIEMEILKRPVGKQDQYLAAFGGLTVLEIARDGRVSVREAKVDPGVLTDFIANTHIYYTGVKRDAGDILSDQDRKMKSRQEDSSVIEESLQRIKEIGYRTLDALEKGDPDAVGRLCDEHWRNKMRLSKKILIPGIHELYEETQKRFGVLGGKIVGAGGGGFLMLYTPGRHQELAAFMEERRFKRLQYSVDFAGARVMTGQ